MPVVQTGAGREVSKVLFVTPTLAFGGAERVLLTLIGALDRSAYEPVLAALSRTGSYRTHLPDWLRVHDLERKTRLSFPGLVLRMARVLRRERPDIAVAFTGLANFVLILAQWIARADTRIIVTEHINPTQMYTSPEEPLGLVKRKMIRWLYPAADRVIAVSQGVKADLVGRFGLPQEKIAVVYDPVDLQRVRDLGAQPVDHPWFGSAWPVIVSTGRMTPQKDFPTLLRAFALLRRSCPARLFLIGDGPEMNRLQDLARELGIAEDTAFMGYQPNPYKYMARAAMFVLPSRFEGFGLVLVEAMALGVPVISTRCPSGPEEILRSGADGLLVPVGDNSRLASAMARLLTKPELRRWFGECGRARALHFAADRIAGLYCDCMANLQVMPPVNREPVSQVTAT
jgi:glycosyltransferase involved in cell wall biosynthesis